jgi:hypothetical protein
MINIQTKAVNTKNIKNPCRNPLSAQGLCPAIRGNHAWRQFRHRAASGDATEALRKGAWAVEVIAADRLLWHRAGLVIVRVRHVDNSPFERST